MELKKYESVQTVTGQAATINIIIHHGNVVVTQPPRVNYIIGEKKVKWKITVEELPNEEVK